MDRHILQKICQQYFEIDTEDKKDVLDTFNELWTRYTCKNVLPGKHGFLDLGGNSISALQMITELSMKFSRIPKDLIDLLLKNGDFDKCCKSLSQADVEPNIVSNIVNETKASLNSDTNTKDQPLLKKIKLDEEYDKTLSLVQFRGRNITFSSQDESYCRKKFRIDMNSVYLKAKWKVNLGKCIDGSPVFVHYKR